MKKYYYIVIIVLDETKKLNKNWYEVFSFLFADNFLKNKKKGREFLWPFKNLFYKNTTS